MVVFIVVIYDEDSGQIVLFEVMGGVIFVIVIDVVEFEIVVYDLCNDILWMSGGVLLM